MVSKVSADRIRAFQKILKKQKLDGYIVNDIHDTKYLTDFDFHHPGELSLLVTQKKLYCFGRSLYLPQFSKAVAFSTMYASDDYNGDMLVKVKALKLKKVGFDFTKESYLNGKFFKKNKFIEAPSLITEMRKIKIKEGIQRIRKACKIAYETYEIMRKKIKTGMTEQEVALELERTMRLKGATDRSFESVVCFGPGAAEPHHIPTNKKLKENECVLIDFGCIYKGYCSDMTRSWWHGKKPNAEYKKIHALVQKSHDEGIKKVKVKMKARDLDKICRDVIKKGGYGDKFIHGTGHSLGRQLHEAPFIRETSKDILHENNVFSVEPGIYIPGKFGVRIEDLVVLTKQGAKILTKK